jgi:hypothetical protein
LDKEKDGEDRSMGVDLTSPIPQVDGAGNNISDPVQYRFVSDYHQDDIGYALEEIFPAGCATLVSCVAPRPKESADQHCIVAEKRTDGQDTSWPEMMKDQEQVFQELVQVK